MRVHIVRHAEAIPREGAAVLDEERWLTAGGRARFRKVGKRLRKVLDGKISAIYTSPLVRAVQTAELLAGELEHEGAIEVWQALKTGVAARAVVQRLAELDAGARVALVGHEPQMSEIVAELLGVRTFPLPFPKGAVASVDYRLQRTGGKKVRFHWLLVPKGRRFLGLDGNPLEGVG